MRSLCCAVSVLVCTAFYALAGQPVSSDQIEFRDVSGLSYTTNTVLTDIVEDIDAAVTAVNAQSEASNSLFQAAFDVQTATNAALAGDIAVLAAGEPPANDTTTTNFTLGWTSPVTNYIARLGVGRSATNTGISASPLEVGGRIWADGSVFSGVGTDSDVRIGKGAGNGYSISVYDEVGSAGRDIYVESGTNGDNFALGVYTNNLYVQANTATNSNPFSGGIVHTLPTYGVSQGLFPTFGFISTNFGVGVVPTNGYTFEVAGDALVSGFTADSVQFTGGTGTQGTVSWNTDEETLDVICNGAVLQIGQEQYYHVRNNTASTITNGTVVSASGTLGASGRITIEPFIADGSIPIRYLLGVATEDIEVAGDGKVTSFGKVRSIDCSSFGEGVILYPSDTVAGALQTNEPAFPSISTPIAITINDYANGTIMVRAHNQDDNAYVQKADSSYTNVAAFATNSVQINDGSRLYSVWSGSTNSLYIVSPDSQYTNLLMTTY